jgi:CBS domain-containing protein
LVFDYVAGKEDWLANDLPYEGTLTETPTLGALANRQVATCSLHDPAAAVRQRLEQDRSSFCVVVNEIGVVLGLLRLSDEENWAGAVEQVMKSGPTTLRPHTTAADASKMAEQKNLEPVLVTTSDGRLIGALHAEDLNRFRSA